MGVQSVLNKIETSQLIWLGHIERMEMERSAKRAQTWQPGGMKPRGRPRNRWQDGLEETFKTSNA